ncbi:MAG TPA: response regulator transcription factor [Anaerolineales bacterium]|nr:response regulator transcription factor [Anaerolineales bacterium]
MINVIIVDDHPIVRAGMRAVLDTEPEINVIADGSTGTDALTLVAEKEPDVLILDVNLPDINGLEVTHQLSKGGKATAILILTAHDDDQMVFSLLESGAIGYVLKDEALETLGSAVHAAARGESWLSPAVASKVVQRALRGEGNLDEEISHPNSPLTPREMEILQLLAQSLDNATIAKELVITKRTVQNHISNIYGKLGVNSRTEAMLYAIRCGWARVNET